MYISTTHLQLKSIWKVFSFFKYNGKVQSQIKTAKGVISIDSKGTSFTNFYTITSWKSKEDMLDFMRSGAHATAMKNSPQFAFNITTHGYEGESVPSWEKAIKRLHNKKNS